jgi:hypothetical protein
MAGQSPDHEMLAFLENQQLMRLEDYVKRGRELAGIDGGELRERWITEFRKWVAFRPRYMDQRVREDIEGELALRGEQPPFDFVKDELETLRAASRAAMDQLKRDPLALARAERKLADDMIEFSQSSKAKPAN